MSVSRHFGKYSKRPNGILKSNFGIEAVCLAKHSSGVSWVRTVGSAASSLNSLKRVSHLVSRGGRYFDLIQRFIRQKHKATLVKPRFEPVIGACLIGLRELKIPRTEQVVANVACTVPRTQPK